jgi:hypothetical protein
VWNYRLLYKNPVQVREAAAINICRTCQLISFVMQGYRGYTWGQQYYTGQKSENYTTNFKC